MPGIPTKGEEKALAQTSLPKHSQSNPGVITILSRGIPRHNSSVKVVGKTSGIK